MEHRHRQIHVQNIAISIYIFHHYIASHHKHWCHVDIIIRDDSTSSRSQALEAKSSEYPFHPDKHTNDTIIINTIFAITVILIIIIVIIIIRHSRQKVPSTLPTLTSPPSLSSASASSHSSSLQVLTVFLVNDDIGGS